MPFTLSAVENHIFNKEKQLGLGATHYPFFQDVIKRYGYVGQVRDSSLKEVQNEINISFKKLDEQGTPLNQYFRAEKGFDHGNYDVEYILALGYLNCYHLSEEENLDSLWGIVNPDITDTVSKERLLTVIKMILYYAVEVPQEIITLDTEIDASVRDYIAKVHSQSRQTLATFEQTLPEQVSREQLKDILPYEKWSSAFRIRAHLAPELAKA
uniref:Uncharacterized protein n=1 Tax=Kahliella matisi TaxID=479472 RepID=B8X448_9STIC|nr:hypothetical protein [Kahliella matisi]